MLKPDSESEETAHPELSAALISAVPQIAQILFIFDHEHPVIGSWLQWVSKCAPNDKHNASHSWILSLPFAVDPGWEALILAPLFGILKHPILTTLSASDRYDRVWGPGAVLLYCIAIHFDLGEVPSLDGVILDELKRWDVLEIPKPASAALLKMWSSIDPFEIKRKKGWTFDQLSRYQLKFTQDHVVYDPTLHSPRFERIRKRLPETEALDSDTPTKQKGKCKRKRVADDKAIKMAEGDLEGDSGIRRSRRLKRGGQGVVN
jgi:hypothetical protein